MNEIHLYLIVVVANKWDWSNNLMFALNEHLLLDHLEPVYSLNDEVQKLLGNILAVLR